MNLVEAYMADLVIVFIKDRDLVRLLKYLDSILSKMKGTPSGQHSLRGVGATAPLSSISPFFLTTSAVAGFKIGFV
jgi:hypothetical protein